MSYFFNRRISIAIFALFSLGSASMARADVLFHNVSDQPITFSIDCSGNGSNDFTVDPGSDEQVYCTNGSQAAQIEIRTDRGSYDDVVHAIVWDNRRYELGYDDNGDVNIESL